MDILIAIDDVHPEQGWGLKDDKCMDYLDKLNKEFGAKFTLFIPSNYHGKYPISEYQDWINWLNSKDYFELAAHGHYHDCRSGGPGECEMMEHNYTSACKRLYECLDEWDEVGIKPKGWRMPGWLGTQGSFDAVSVYFDYVAIHDNHNNNISFNDDIKVIKGHAGIHETDITFYNNRIMFQSHIAGNHNDNVWNEANYGQIRLSLEHLMQQEIEFKTIGELV